MADGLTQQAERAFAGGDEIDRILSLPITKLRIELKHHFQKKKMTAEEFDDFTARLGQVENISSQVAIAKKAITARAVDSEFDIELNTPAKQLLWAASLTRMMTELKEPVARSTLWKQMQNTIGLNNEAIGVSKVISKSLQNDATTFDFGQPGSWFYFDPRKNHINLDLYYMLLMGFEHSRAVTLHEIGHSELSNTYSPRMKALYEKVKIIIDPRTIEPGAEEKATGKKPRTKLKKAEYKQLALEVAEWKLRFKLWHMTEDNAVNQFSSNMKSFLTQDFGNSLNYVSAVLQGFGELITGDFGNTPAKVTTNKPPDAGTPEREVWEQQVQAQAEKEEKAKQKREEAMRRATTPLTDDEVKDVKAGNISPAIAVKMFEQINTTVLLAFYEQNGLFRGTDKTWERFHIIPEDIRKAVDVSKIPSAHGKDAFEYLIDLAVGLRNPDKVLMDVPPERQRALLYLDELASKKQVTTGIFDLNASFDAPAAKQTPEQKRADAAREILARPGVMGKAAETVEDPVETLLQQAARARGIRNLQPQASDRFLEFKPHKTVADGYRALVGTTSEQRGLLMEHLWDTFLKPYADVILQEHEKKLDKKLDKKKDPNKDQQGDDKDQKQDKNQKGDKGQKGQKGKSGGGGGEGGEPDDSGEQENSGGDSMPDIDQDDDNEQEGPDNGIDVEDEDSDNKGKPQPGEEGEESDETDLDDDLKKEIGDLSETPGEERDKENGAGGKEEKNDKNDQNKDGQGKENKEDKDGEPSSGFDQDDLAPPQKPRSVRDLKDKTPAKEDLTDKEKQDLRDDVKDAKDAKDLSRDTAGPDNKIDLAKLAKGDWRDFNARIQELGPVINRLARTYKKIREQQRRQIRKMSRNHEYFPQDGNLLGRLNRDKVKQVKLKEAFGEPVTTDDLKRVKKDEPAWADSTIEFIAMIDGSGSMPDLDLGNGVTAMEVALQSAVINYMAARKAGIDAYIVMWGNDKPLVIAEPDTPLQLVGERLEGVRNGIKSGTALTPGLLSSIGAMADHKNRNGTISGSSHILVYSDGDIQDAPAAQEALRVISQNSKNLSVDVAVLQPKGSNPNKKTAMENAVQAVVNETGGKNIGILRGDDAQQVPIDLSQRVLRRVRKFKVEVEPDNKKRGRLKRLHEKLKGL